MQLIVTRTENMRLKYTYLKYDDPTLYDSAYYTVMCDGFCIGTAHTEDEAQRLIRDHKKELKTKTR